MAVLANSAVILTAADGTDQTVTAGNAASGWQAVAMSASDCPLVYTEGELTKVAQVATNVAPLPRRRLKVWTGTEWRELDAYVKGLA